MFHIDLTDELEKEKKFLDLLDRLPPARKSTALYLIDHLRRYDLQNKSFILHVVYDYTVFKNRAKRISFSWGGCCSFKIRPTHRSIDDTLIQPKFVG